MKIHQRFISILALSVLLPFSGLMASAQDPGQDQDYADQSVPPAQSADIGTNTAPDSNAAPAQDAPERAARLQYTEGSVSLQPQGTGEWIAGQLNRPLTNADNVWADKNSKAEISVGTGLIRIDSETSLTLSNIGENMVQLSLHQGAMNLHVRRLYDNETYEVDTPNQAFTVLKPGDYRFDVDSDADKTIITVWRGQGQSSTNGQTVKISENQQARFGEGSFSADDIHGAPAPDTFDEWARSRDEKLDHSASARYVSPDVPGYEDLDEYGNWKHNDDYGDVWVPNDVPAGWAPYTNGHWIWQNPWGWTWVDYDPWGYAPFHYGRWVYGGGYWGWAPGPIWARPYYAPALVTWFGGPGWGVSFGFGGGFGWCPLGWGEPFVPWYHASFGYFRGVNFTNAHFNNFNIRNVYNNNFMNGRPRPGGGMYGAHNGTQLRYANLRAPGGFTAVSRNTLVNSMPVSRNRISVSSNQLSRATALRGGLAGVRPTRTSMLGGNFSRAAAPPPHAFSRPMVSRTSNPANRGNSGFRTQANGGFARPSSPMSNARSENASVRGMTPSNQAGFGGRSVPHPPSAAGFGNRGGMRSGAPMESAHSAAPNMRPQSVPRPPSGSMPRTGEPSFGGPRGASAPQMNGPRGGERPQMNAPRAPDAGGQRGNAPRSNGPHSQMTVPRPANSTDPRGYSAATERGSYSSPRSQPNYQANGRTYGGGSYGRSETSSRPSPNYGGRSETYSRPSPNYGGGAYSRPAPSYDRGSYGRSTPSYGGGGNYGRSMPSYGGGSYGRSMPSDGGGRAAYGGGGRMPSYGGGGGGGGGGRSYGGGGGHASSGGGGHSSGGGGGGGGGRGGRH